MKDCRGSELQVGDTVYIYWGYNQLRPGKIHCIQGTGAQVMVDTGCKPESRRYSLSKLKGGECMIKVGFGEG